MDSDCHSLERWYAARFLRVGVILFSLDFVFVGRVVASIS